MIIFVNTAYHGSPNKTFPSRPKKWEIIPVKIDEFTSLSGFKEKSEIGRHNIALAGFASNI